VRGEGGGVPWRGGWGRGKRELRRAEACLGPMEALCRAFPRGQNLQPMSSSDHFPARNRLQPKSVRIQANSKRMSPRRAITSGQPRLDSNRGHRAWNTRTANPPPGCPPPDAPALPAGGRQYKPQQVSVPVGLFATDRKAALRVPQPKPVPAQVPLPGASRRDPCQRN